jgi:hypothetical protein
MQAAGFRAFAVNDNVLPLSNRSCAFVTECTRRARVDDPRYRDVSWLSGSRRWPPALVANLQAFLKLQSVEGVVGAAS